MSMIEQVYQDMQDFGKLVTKRELREAIFAFGEEIVRVDNAVSFSLLRQANTDYLLVGFENGGVSDSDFQNIDYSWMKFRNGLPSSIAGKFPRPLVFSREIVSDLRSACTVVTLWQRLGEAA